MSDIAATILNEHGLSLQIFKPPHLYQISLKIHPVGATLIHADNGHWTNSLIPFLSMSAFTVP